MFKSKRFIPFIFLLTSHVQGVEEDLLARLQAQSQPARAANTGEPIYLLGKQDRNWLSLGPSSSKEEPKSKRLKMDRESNDLPTEKLDVSTDFGTKFLRGNGHGEPESHESSASRNSIIINQAEKVNSLPPYKAKHSLRPSILHLKGTNPTTLTEPRPEAIQPVIHGTTVYISDSFRQEILAGSPSTTTEPSIKQLRAPSGWISENRRRYMYDQELAHNPVVNHQSNQPVVQLQEQQYLHAGKNTRHDIYTTHHQNEQERNIANLASKSSSNQPDIFQNWSNSKLGSNIFKLNINKSHKNYQTDAAKEAIDFKSTLRANNENEEILRRYNEYFLKNASKYSLPIDENNTEKITRVSEASKAKFKSYLMNLIDPENHFIQSDLIQKYIYEVENSEDNLLKDSMGKVLSYINEHIKIDDRENFYVRDIEVKEFFSVSYYKSFRIKHNSNVGFSSNYYYKLFLTDFKKYMQEVNLKDIISKFYEVDKTNFLPTYNPEFCEKSKANFNAMENKKQYVAKVFLSYSTLINKIFYDGPNNESFVKRQLDAIKLCTLFIENFKQDGIKISLISIKELEELDKSLGIESKQGILDLDLIAVFNRRFKNLNGYNRDLFSDIWVLIKFWLSRCRPNLYDILKNPITFDNSFKPFVNSFFQIIMQISK
ncbi:hypothetical protein BY996DRAFT_7952363 [Phakopsora pachyrhizi]|uniref:Expressed protein n=1 Tax=Phakopsora pachyrhizi TaxID=170000 RepID=A0AAV0BAC4_PHAPC|nr:hypothetical protein BY996DRAFT_7952363 [Phakopsora pachyrhizi]CAH7683984.1 expressed protein [Phakopsora pachyrhizi]